MAERLTTIIKTLLFTEAQANAREISFSDASKICLDRNMNIVTLVDNGDGFPLDEDLVVQSETLTVRSLRKILALEIVGATKKKVDGSVVTSVGIRVNDGTASFFWNGSAWASVSSPEDWSTEDDVSANLESYSPASKTFRLIMNLRTTSKLVAPEVSFVKIAMSVRVPSSIDDVLARSLVRKMKEGVRPLTVFSVVLPATTDEFDFAAFMANKAIPKPEFDITGIEGVFLASDEDQENNLLDSYSDGVITLSSAQAVGTNLKISAEYAPSVVLWRRSVDYYTPKRVPEICISETMTLESSQLPGGDLTVTRNSLGEYLEVTPPYRVTMQMTAMAFSASAKDEARLGEEMVMFFRDNQMIESRATGDRFRIHVTQEFRDATYDNGPAELCSGSMTFKIYDLLIYKGEHQVKRLSGALHLDGDFSQIVSSS